MIGDEFLGVAGRVRACTTYLLIVDQPLGEKLALSGKGEYKSRFAWCDTPLILVGVKMDRTMCTEAQLLILWSLKTEFRRLGAPTEHQYNVDFIVVAALM